MGTKRTKTFFAALALSGALNAKAGDLGGYEAVAGAIELLNERVGLVETADEGRREGPMPYWMVRVLLERPVENLKKSMHNAGLLDEATIEEAGEAIEKAEERLAVPSFREGDRV